MCFCCFDTLDDNDNDDNGGWDEEDITKDTLLDDEDDEKEEKLDIFDIFKDVDEIDDIEWDINYDEDAITEEIPQEEFQEMLREMDERFCNCDNCNPVENFADGKKFYICKNCKKEVV